ncbi:MAG: hypothetical protein ACLRMZ_24860 [Blautia marasmi]
MSKQADAILGMYLHSNLFTKELKRNYDFYQEVTLHHSSLSTCIFGILACEIGYYEEAYTFSPNPREWIWTIIIITFTQESMRPIWPAPGSDRQWFRRT